MPGTARKEAFSVECVRGLANVPAEDWDALANPAGEPFDPFLTHAFLEALEASGCASPRTGWTPLHLLLRNAAGRLEAAAPLYAKDHSRGEFVFDHAWADALERAGGRYYPKLLCAVPFTPVTGRRLLVRPGSHAPEIRRALARALKEIATVTQSSSIHANFGALSHIQSLLDEGFLPRTDQQFHWINRGYNTFEDFLGALTSRKRKMIRKERAIASEGLTLHKLTGDDISDHHWDAFFRFYMDTGGRKWGSPYLNRRFFSLLHERLAHNCLLIIASDGATPVAGALNLIGSDALYGRYWGRLVDRPFLHFEVCYYQAMEFAIERGLARVEAGAQGEHKLARGYEPIVTRSAHWIAHPGLQDAVARYLERERAAVDDQNRILQDFTPFRKSAADTSHSPDEEESF